MFLGKNSREYCTHPFLPWGFSQAEETPKTIAKGVQLVFVSHCPCPRVPPNSTLPGRCVGWGSDGTERLPHYRSGTQGPRKSPRWSQSECSDRPTMVLGSIWMVACSWQSLPEFAIWGLKYLKGQDRTAEDWFCSYLTTVGASRQIPSAELRWLDPPVQILIAVADFVLDHRQLGFLEQTHAKGACV